MWNNIIGHERQKEQLTRAIDSNNIPHAYLFSGINGIGKKLVAKRAAKFLLNQTTESHPDLVQIAPENNTITIDQIREVKNQLKFSPLEGSRRVIIVDQAELMNTNAANAALKILEEPPPGNHFFLITATPSQLLPTIISRCQKLNFSPLTNKELTEYLIANHGYSGQQAEAAAAISEGSIERALNITPDLIDQIIKELFRALNAKSTEEILEVSSRWASDKEALANILHIIHRTFHTALLQKTGPLYGSEINSNDKLTDLIKNNNSIENLIEKCNSINKTHSYVTRTYNKQLMFEQLLFTLAK